MRPDDRRERIVEVVRERARMTVEDLAELLGSSRETIRRDLSQLADDGRLRKFHGGAALPEPHREGPFADRMGESVREKRAIAAVAAGLFPPGSTLFIDVGTTTQIFAEALAGRPGLTVITNGVAIAKILGDSGVTVFGIGGAYHPETGEMLGPLAVEQIGRFHAGHAVITVGGLTKRGAMDFQIDEAQVARAMVGQARFITVIADSSKLHRDALFQVCPLETIDRLVVDRPPDAEFAAALDAAGIEVIVASAG